MVKFENWYPPFREEIIKNVSGTGAYGEPVIATESLHRLVVDRFGTHPQTFKSHISAIVGKGYLHLYPSGKMYSFLDNGTDTPESVMQKLRQQQEAVKP